MKQKVAIITVEAKLEPGYNESELTDWIEHVNAALAAFKYTEQSSAPMRYADFRVIDARLCKGDK